MGKNKCLCCGSFEDLIPREYVVFNKSDDSEADKENTAINYHCRTCDDKLNYFSEHGEWPMKSKPKKHPDEKQDKKLIKKMVKSMVKKRDLK